MPNIRRLTKKQREVIEDLFEGQMNEQEVLERHKVSKRSYDKWRTDEQFLREFDIRLQQERRQGEMVIARYATIAAAKLVQLTESKNPETSRKACLDIINLLRPNAEVKSPEQTDSEPQPDLTPELAGRLLSALAEEK